MVKVNWSLYTTKEDLPAGLTVTLIARKRKLEKKKKNEKKVVLIVAFTEGSVYTYESAIRTTAEVE